MHPLHPTNNPAPNPRPFSPNPAPEPSPTFCTHRWESILGTAEADTAWSKGRLWRDRAHQARLPAWEPLAPACSTTPSVGATEALGSPVEAEVRSSGRPKVAHPAPFDH